MFEYTKWVARSHKASNDRQHNGQKKKDKRTNNDTQNIAPGAAIIALTIPPTHKKLN
jgi:hypothetical protein